MTGYALYVTSDASGEYLTLTARVMALADDGTPRNLAVDDRYNVDPLAGIVATAQADLDPDRGYVYGHRFGLQTNSYEVMSAAQATATLATLRKAQGKLDRLYVRLGDAGSWGAWVARIADVLAIPILTGRTATGSYAEGEYVLWPRTGEVVSILDRWVADFRKAAVR